MPPRDPENFCFDNMCAHIEKWIENHMIILKGDEDPIVKIDRAIEYDRAILRNVEKMRKKYALPAKKL